MFGDVVAVDDVDLDVYDGEFLTLLGPSGSGKTTVLRMIAGFERPDAGTVELAGVDVTDVPPYARDVNTVFQDYALFPHMTVLQNVEYGLMVKKVPKAERLQRALEALESVRLSGYEKRTPSQLSGGQRQRVALARALVNRPKVLLLDEPLGALDLKLREQMQVELKEIQREVGITFVFVTHDQDEALTMSDRIAVMNEGVVEQIGSPEEIYNRPQSLFVAGFIGSANLLPGHVRDTTPSGCVVELLNGQRVAASGSHAVGSKVSVMLRPERLHPVAERPADGFGLRGTVTSVIFQGAWLRVVVELPDGTELSAEAGGQVSEGVVLVKLEAAS